jgi:hypothetical protein
MVRGFFLLIACAALSASCTAGGVRRDGGNGTDAGRFDAGFDAGRAFCDDNLDCDDGHACTDELCVIGNVCEYTTFNSRCDATANERCVAGRGCVASLPTECTEDSECDDGQYCNGVEDCLGEMCFPGTPRTCDDGNECTTDICDEAMDGCRRETAPGCDGGVSNFDGGRPCDPFDPGMHYSGTMLLNPTQSCFPGSGPYTVDEVSFAVSGGTLTVTAGPFSLTQSPAPTGASFDVSGGDSCATVRLTGTFDCRMRFTGHWTAQHTGRCALCGTTSVAVDGVR